MFDEEIFYFGAQSTDNSWMGVRMDAKIGCNALPETISINKGGSMQGVQKRKKTKIGVRRPDNRDSGFCFLGSEIIGLGAKDLGAQTKNPLERNVLAGKNPI